ncbi:hypothetical protein GCM10027280_35920 [Micromonospora polyrhachis]|uniref:Uncharacterized protein n=1 Tax=Micromonospora polyrhachis TaxID=1282883 RepID=A0A7W7WPK9_9ACTN|nr:hypothetical protein [Micromonospora polyrhachis]MBB4958804.1 hypothetical protein [Micromonospora polyrhachis]
MFSGDYEPVPRDYRRPARTSQPEADSPPAAAVDPEVADERPADGQGTAPEGTVPDRGRPATRRMPKQRTF